jgi:hypothetical protein
MALQGTPYIYDISRLRVKLRTPVIHSEESTQHFHIFYSQSYYSHVALQAGRSRVRFL